MKLRGLTFTHTRTLNNKIRSFAETIYLIKSYFFNYLKYKKKDMFCIVDIELSTICNRKCNYCPVSKYKINKKKIMNKKTFENIINHLVNIKYEGEIRFGGFGEPLLNKKILQYLKYARQKLKNKVIIAIHTNGDYLNKSYIKFFEKNRIRAYVSLHDNSKNTLKHISKYKKSKFIFIRNMKDSYLTTCGGIISVPKREIKTKCIHSQLILTINSEGKIILCCEDFFSEYIFGDLNKNSIKKIWNNIKYKKIRNNLTKGLHKYKICKYCFLK